MNSIEKEVRKRLNDLGNLEFCNPIDIFSISNQIAEELYPDISVEKIIEKYGSHKNAFVRRAILTSIRFIGSEFAEKNIQLIRDSLQDNNEWVVYDAAWILFDMNTIQSNDIKILKSIAKELSSLPDEELESFEPKEASDYASKQAAQAIKKHNNT